MVKLKKAFWGMRKLDGTDWEFEFGWSGSDAMDGSIEEGFIAQKTSKVGTPRD
ncbi:MAG: hypothetical protein WA715_02735 [Candidatus Acidiferrum sp.]